MSSESQPYSVGATAVAVAPEASPAPGDVRSAVITALETSKQQSVANLVADGEWSTAGGEVIVKVSAGAKFVDMAFNTEAKRVANAAASTALSRPMKIRIVPGQAMSQAPQPRPANGGPGARSRAAEDPVVRRMQEKFGAEIRTVIDHRDKR